MLGTARAAAVLANIICSSFFYLEFLGNIFLLIYLFFIHNIFLRSRVCDLSWNRRKESSSGSGGSLPLDLTMLIMKQCRMKYSAINYFKRSPYKVEDDSDLKRSWLLFQSRFSLQMCVSVSLLSSGSEILYMWSVVLVAILVQHKGWSEVSFINRSGRFLSLNTSTISILIVSSSSCSSSSVLSLSQSLSFQLNLGSVLLPCPLFILNSSWNNHCISLPLSLSLSLCPAVLFTLFFYRLTLLSHLFFQEKRIPFCLFITEHSICLSFPATAN